MLEVENLHLHAGTHPVACGYSVQFHAGEVTATTAAARPA